MFGHLLSDEVAVPFFQDKEPEFVPLNFSSNWNPTTSDNKITKNACKLADDVEATVKIFSRQVFLSTIGGLVGRIKNSRNLFDFFGFFFCGNQTAIIGFPSTIQGRVKKILNIPLKHTCAESPR